MTVTKVTRAAYISGLKPLSFTLTGCSYNLKLQEARGKGQEARVKKFSAILRFFTQFGFIVFTYLGLADSAAWR
jgi:hypothetical protein